jgi:DNA-binding transcriptional ArsR family regulator
MASHADQIRLRLAEGPAGARQLLENIGISQPTLSRAMTTMGSEVVRLGAARSIQYALRDAGRGLDDIAIYRVGAD